MNILITGFEPFDGEALNPSEEVIRYFGAKSTFGPAHIHTLCLPVTFETSCEMVLESLAELQPTHLLMLGQGAKNGCIALETIAFNWIDARIPDATGLQPKGTRISDAQRSSHVTTLPTTEMLRRLRAQDIPAEKSFWAGSYVCNALFFKIMHHIAQQSLQTSAGFIHLPFLPEQCERNPRRIGLPLEKHLQGIACCLEACLDS